MILQMAQIWDSFYTFWPLIKAWAAKITDETQNTHFYEAKSTMNSIKVEY